MHIFTYIHMHNEFMCICVYMDVCTYDYGQAEDADSQHLRTLGPHLPEIRVTQ